MEKMKSWLRFAEWFRPSRRMAFVSRGTVPAGRIGVDAAVIATGSNGRTELKEVSSLGEHPEGHSARFRWLRKAEPNPSGPRNPAWIESLLNHFETMDRRSAKATAALDQAVASLAYLPAWSKTQLELLSSIRDSLDQNASRSKRMEDALSQWPQLADAQRETMVSIGRQLDAARQTDERLVQGLSQLHDAVRSLSAVTVSAAATAQQMHAETRLREEGLTRLLEKHTKQITLVAYGAMAVAAAAAGVGLLTVFLR